MSLLGTLNPNPSRSQSVVSHNTVHPPGEHDLNMISDLEKDGDEDTIQEEENREALVGRLARQLTRQSTRFSVNGALDNPFTNEDSESSLNPNSPNFKARDWMKMLLAIRSRNPDKYPDRTAGIAFQNLSVHGFGSPTDYQKDVLNSLLELGTMVRRLAGLKLQKIQILRDFDGLVRSGETLVVLGKPGSGCSTLLKTIAGEMNGIEMSEESVLNYQGKF
ncbi:hypothetical protein N7517_004015 [Penicillium concentricum]|uniref:ABC transporter domain-containing protein n=1 Tax=Penicillium concentricum TaxID=293559 RepID=A0A9W9V8Z8_9EURO|nr:uncharacterized protein N7517_004015 [Penicillium concentricum]KAJ5372009.1 hypothetical protein N7517_004015 [Penicillium concentricum]